MVRVKVLDTIKTILSRKKNAWLNIVTQSEMWGEKAKRTMLRQAAIPFIDPLRIAETAIVIINETSPHEVCGRI